MVKRFCKIFAYAAGTQASSFRSLKCAMYTAFPGIKKDIKILFQQKVIMAIVALAVLLAGTIYIKQTWNYYIGQTNEWALGLAESAAAFIPPDLIIQLKTSYNDWSQLEHHQIRDSLIQFRENQSNIQQAYLYTVVDGNTLILATSHESVQPGYVFPGEITSELIAMDIKPFTTGQPIISDPITDQAGTWIKTLVPVKEPHTGDIVAVLGVDYPARLWYKEARKHVAHSSVVFTSIVLLLIIFYILLSRNRALVLLSRELENSQELLLKDTEERIQIEKALYESERHKSVLMSHLPGMAYRCKYDMDWTMEFISDGCQALTGYPPESLLYNNELSFNDIISFEYQEALRKEWKRVILLKTSFKSEYEIITAAGERKWVLELGQPVYNDNDEVEALEGLVIDITDQKLRELQIEYMHDHDFLTGMYNRRFYEKARQQYDNEECLPLSIITIDINGVRIINDAFGYSAGDLLIVETARIIQNCCRDKDIAARTGSDEFYLLLPQTDQKTTEEMVNRIKIACNNYNQFNHNDLFHIDISVGCCTKESAGEDITQVEKTAEEHMYNSKLLNRKSSHNAILSSIMATMYARSHETEEHSNRIAVLCKMIGKRLNLPEKSLNDLELLAMLHDIGKVGIDDQILNKPGPLNEEEWAHMKKHPEIGYRIAMSSAELEPIADYILYHHERWDGTGYPRGLKGEAIPLLSRIMAVADAFDAMTEDRTYRPGMTKEAAIAEIKKNAGSQFDPNIAQIFIEMDLDQVKYG